MKDAIHAFWCAIRRYIRCDKAQWDFVEYEENDPHYATTIQKARQLELLEARTDLLTVGKELAESLKQHGHDSTAVLELRDAALHRPYRIEDLLPSLRIELEKVTIRESLKTTEEDPTFLGLHVDEADRIITRDGYPGESSDFGRKGRAWQLLHALWKAKDEGLSRNIIMRKVWKDGPVNDSNLDTQKGKANEVLESLKVEITADNRGIWRLTAL